MNSSRTHRKYSHPFWLQSVALAAVCLTTAFPTPAQAATRSSPRTQLAADGDWRFFLGDAAGAEAPSFDDHSWSTVTLPHDWSIEARPDRTNPSGSGGGYFPGGIGWYRKTFTAPASWKGRKASIEFDGISANATVYLNGQQLGIHPYAYTSFRFDLTPDLKLGTRNVLAVRVDTSNQPSSRWYSGSGIYRHVRVVLTSPIHVSPWGVFVSTPEASTALGKVSLRTEVQNDTSKESNLTIRTMIVDPAGVSIPAANTEVKIAAGLSAEAVQEIAVERPRLWSPDNPVLYRAVTQVIKSGRVIDQVETPFGIRSLAWSVDKGLLLNGAAIKLAGGSVHHDNGPLGAAAFDRAEERKVQLLKAAGFNAVRTAHNPPSPAFLDACDRLGLLVLEDPFDVWTIGKVKYDYARFFKDWWQQDLDAMVKRDRNHPSIILWGIGNEIPEVWTKDGAPMAKELAARVRSLDASRPLTEAFPGATYGPNPDAVMTQLDIAGYNYNLAQNQSEDHRRVPERIMMTTESLPADAFEQWALVKDHTHIVGEFVWTAMDYLGESGIGSWSYVSPQQAQQLSQMKPFLRKVMASMGADGKNPFAMMPNGPGASPLFPGYPWHASYCGDMDLTGFRKPWSYYRDILWNGGDRVFATVRLPEPEREKIVAVGWGVYPTLPSWTWPGQEGKSLTVEVYSGAQSVRLFLNDKLVGEKQTGRGEAFTATFEVPYAPGVLKAVGMRGDKVVAEDVLSTVGAPVRLKLTPDRAVLHADGQDLVFVTVEAVDDHGRTQLNANQNVRLTASGPGQLIAVGTGDGKSDGAYRGNSFPLFYGRGLAILRTTGTPGQIGLSATADGLAGSSVVMESQQTASIPELR